MTADSPVRLARSTLFVPASRPEMIPKAAASAADAVCIDLEDSVVPAEKPAGRANIIRALREIDFGHRTRIVRINALDGPYAYRDLVDVVEAVGDRMDLVMMPKAGSGQDVVFVDMLLSQIEQSARIGRRLGIEAQIETARGFTHLAEIAAASPRLEALIFGAGDYAASMHMPSSAIGELDVYDEVYPGHRWHAPMHAIVAAARTNGLRCMDGPYAGYTDTAGLERTSRIAQSLGFDGKQCIHPVQLVTVNRVFSPSDGEVAQATAMVRACEAAEAAGQGAATFEGRMIDGASLRMARATLERHKLIAT